VTTQKRKTRKTGPTEQTEQTENKTGDEIHTQVTERVWDR
jgi:hypothetical protein